MNIKVKDDTTKYALQEAIRQYKYWLEEANMDTDEIEYTEGHYEALEDIEKQLEN
jgi:hypothetical protein